MTVHVTSALDQRYPDPVYCLRCNEQLEVAGQSRCPTCGLQYDTNRCETFRRHPHFLRWKFWFPGLCLSIVSGVLSYAVCLQNGDLGWALFVAVPVSFGAILGYATRVRAWLLAMLMVTVVTSVVMVLMSMHLAGVFCGMTLGIMFMGPASFGIVLGLLLRISLERSKWDQRWFLPLVGFFLLPYVVQGVESALPRRHVIAEVRTALTVDASPQEAWDAVMFYEQVEHKPPWLLRLALPKPLRSVGDKTQEGEVVRCFYDRGYLSKRISRVEPNRRLTFEVVEQKLHFERDIKLLGGSFELTPSPDGRGTEIVLLTRYERRLSPRWMWESMERKIVHTLHEHVLEGMRRKIDADAQKWRQKPYVPVRSELPRAVVRYRDEPEPVGS